MNRKVGPLVTEVEQTPVQKLTEALTREQVLHFLAQSASYGNLGLFVGAGLSKAVLNDAEEGVALSWGELLQKAASKMGVDYDSINKVGASYPEVASSICTVHSQMENVVFAHSLRLLKQSIAELTSWYPSQEQRKTFAGFLEAMSPAWIITTNYDLVVESLLTGNSIPLGPNDALSAPKGVVPVFHLHGVRTNPQEIIIAQEDYVALFRPTEYRQMKLALTIKESTTLFVGYGLGDVNVLTALDWSRNVFKEQQEKELQYPRDVIQIVRRNNPSEKPYRDRNGIVILETAELSTFFSEFVQARDAFAEKRDKERVALKELEARLNSPDTSRIDRFIDDKKYRGTMLEVLSRFSIHLIAGFISFLDKCIEQTWERSAPTGAFEGYNQNLIIILDILTAFPLDRFPPALFQTAAYALQRVAYYVGDQTGQSWSAGHTWEKRKSELSGEIVQELRNVAEQYNYWTLLQLLKSIPQE